MGYAISLRNTLISGTMPTQLGMLMALTYAMNFFRNRTLMLHVVLVSIGNARAFVVYRRF